MNPLGNASPSQLHTSNRGDKIGNAILPDIDQMDGKPASDQFNILGTNLQADTPAENVDIDKEHLAAFPLYQDPDRAAQRAMLHPHSRSFLKCWEDIKLLPALQHGTERCDLFR
jgi:hypothetical protein